MYNKICYCDDLGKRIFFEASHTHCYSFTRDIK